MWHHSLQRPTCQLRQPIARYVKLCERLQLADLVRQRCNVVACHIERSQTWQLQTDIWNRSKLVVLQVQHPQVPQLSEVTGQGCEPVGRQVQLRDVRVVPLDHADKICWQLRELAVSAAPDGSS